MEQCTNVNVHFSVAAGPLAHAQQKRDRELLFRRWTPFTAKQRRSGVTLRIQLCVCRLLRLSVCLFGCLFVCLFVCVSLCLCVRLFVCLLVCYTVRCVCYACKVVCLYGWFCVCLCVGLYVWLLVCVFVCVFVSVHVCSFVVLFVLVFCLCVCLFVCLVKLLEEPSPSLSLPEIQSTSPPNGCRLRRGRYFGSWP